MSFGEYPQRNSIQKEQFYLRKITPKYRYLPISIFGVILLLIVFLFSFTADSSVPGDLGYPIDRLFEKFSLSLKFNDYDKVKKYYDIANERFIEYQRVDWEHRIYGNESNHRLDFAKNETLNAVNLSTVEIDKYMKKNKDNSNEINRGIVLMKKKLSYIVRLVDKNEKQIQEKNSVIKKIKQKNGSIKQYFELID